MDFMNTLFSLYREIHLDYQATIQESRTNQKSRRVKVYANSDQKIFRIQIAYILLLGRANIMDCLT